MSLRKLKEALQNALKDGNKKLAAKTKEAIKKKRAWKPDFPGQHRGY
jgi:hypothetical protein